MRFVPFHPDHLAVLQLQEIQALEQEHLRDPKNLGALAAYIHHPPFAWSGEVHGLIVGSAGLIPMWPGRAIAWALIGAIPPSCWPAVTRKVQAVLAAAHAQGYWRIEASCLAGFKQGERFLGLLGFKPEGLMEAYDPAARSNWLYARIDPAALARQRAVAHAVREVAA
jgi:hypothetical protein